MAGSPHLAAPVDAPREAVAANLRVRLRLAWTINQKMYEASQE